MPFFASLLKCVVSTLPPPPWLTDVQRERELTETLKQEGAVKNNLYQAPDFEHSLGNALTVSSLTY